MTAEKSHTVKSLRTYLVQLVLVAVIPLLIFASGLIFYVSHQQNVELEHSLHNRAKSVQAVVDDKLGSIISSLEILGLTEDFDPSEFPVIHRKLSRASKNLQGWLSVAVVDLDGNPLIHTAFPFGTKLNPLSDEAFFQKVIRTKKTVISDLRFANNLQEKVISVAIPVFKNNHLSLILVANIAYDLIVQTLKNQNLGDDWYATMVDNSNTVLARTRLPETFVGTKISAGLQDQLKKGNVGFIKTFNKEKIYSFSVFLKSPLTGWNLVMGFPVANLSSYSDITKIVLILALVFILIGIYLALRIGSKISDPIVALSHSAEAFGKGSIPAPVDSTVKEVNILAQSIELASHQRINSENAIRTLHEISSTISGELDLKKLLQCFTDLTTNLTRAQFGAYFNVSSSNGQFMDMVTLSGSSLELFNKFPIPRMTEIFGPTFRGEGIIRLDDVTQDPRFGKNHPYSGMPQGHPPVRSYLAIPVISRTGEVLGGLFFAHEKPGVFTEQDETLMASLAAQAATAIDNASLYTKATQAIELRDTFLSVASHELKTPLTSIYLQFEMLKRTTLKTNGNDPKSALLFDRFQSQLRRLTRLIDELLDVTRIASGKMELHREEVDLDQLVREICANFENEALQKGSPLTLITEEAVSGTWDANRLEQVVTNVVSNAIKYGNKKPVTVTIKKDATTAKIVVRDQGLGIASGDQARIFQRFERAIDSNAISGLGLGLFICKEIIQRHGGDIIVESTLGEGSVFTIQLPL